MLGNFDQSARIWLSDACETLVYQAENHEDPYLDIDIGKTRVRIQLISVPGLNLAPEGEQ